MITSILFTAAAASGASVDPLITSNWSQSGNGYNNNTLEFNGQNAPTGCLSVAFGQVIRHFAYPNRGIGTKSYCNNKEFQCAPEDRVEADFYLTNYDYENMPDSLGWGSSDVEKNAVATLLGHVGAAVGVRYGKDGSAAAIDNPAVFKGLKRHFAMSNAVKKSRDEYSEEEWYELVKDSLLGGEPVILTGTDSKIGAGHAYIVDGIREDGKVHINFGWGGSSNGWYDLNDILVNGRYRFTEEMSAYVGLGPTQHKLNEQCGGRFGEQCEEGLFCLIDDTTRADAHGVCSSSGSEGPVDEEPAVVLKDVTQTLEGKVTKGETVNYGPFSSLGEFIVDMRGETGDADLYVGVGEVPTSSTYACRPYKSGTNENCVLDGPEDDIYIMVSGYEDADYRLTISSQVAAE